MINHSIHYFLKSELRWQAAAAATAATAATAGATGSNSSSLICAGSWTLTPELNTHVVTMS